ncbi:MAG TPA: CRTAC1 family protein [Gemmatimonadaceae bacterium]
MRVTAWPLAVAGLGFIAAISPVPPSTLTFDNVAAQAGLTTFHHAGGGTADKRYIAEVMSGGACAADLDADGWTDIILINGGSFESAAGRGAPPPHGIFRNRHDGTFENVTARTGIANAGWGMGCALADYDADGDPDLYVTNYLAPDQLWRNDGRWSFTDVTKTSGTGGPAGRWNTGATFGDYDADGRLDLFVAGYVHLDPAHLPDPDRTPDCRHRGLVVNCGPRGLPGEGDLLFHNEGSGRFRLVNEAAIDPDKFYGLGAVFLPLGDDGGMRLYVANDSTPNNFYRFEGGRPIDEALGTGLALSEEGHEQAGMGIAWGDYDRDGRGDLYVTNFVDDYSTLYHNLGEGVFEDVTRRLGLSQPTWIYLAWGTAFADFDRDGDDDLVAANGHVYPQVDSLALPSKWRMPVQVFENRGSTFAELPREAVPGVAVGRGLAVADFWNDGRLGFVVNNLDGVPALYRPRAAAGHFLELTLQGTAIPDATGAIVRARWEGGRALRFVASGGSYLSSHDPRVHLGLSAAREADVEIRWPDGTVQQLPRLAADRRYRIAQGGKPVATH